MRARRTEHVASHSSQSFQQKCPFKTRRKICTSSQNVRARARAAEESPEASAGSLIPCETAIQKGGKQQ